MRQRMPGFDARVVKKAEDDLLGVFGKQREVGAGPIPGGAEGKRIAGPDVHARVAACWDPAWRVCRVIDIPGTLPDPRLGGVHQPQRMPGGLA
jgi:hypothetical protein